MFAVVVPWVSAAALAAAAGADPCGVDGMGPLDKLMPALRERTAQQVLGGLRGRVTGERLEVDERHYDVVVAVPKGARAVLPLALPKPLAGQLVLSWGEGGCIDGTVVLFDGALRRVELQLPEGAQAKTQGRGAGKRAPLSAAQLTLEPTRLTLSDVDGAPWPVWVGKGVPDFDVGAGFGANAYLQALHALDEGFETALRTSKGKDARRVVFLALAERLAADLPSVLPAERVKAALDIDQRVLEASERPVARYWRDELRTAPRPGTTTAQARLLIDPDVKEVWVDGARVYDPSMTATVEVKAGGPAARFWIVTDDDGRPIVHDTRAVLRPGGIYTVRSTFVSTVESGARRECLRVEGKLPSGDELSWRELGAVPGPRLDVTDAYRPPLPAAERAIGVVELSGKQASFPPQPLVASYTHPGTYRWSIDPVGSVRLDLLDDVKLCPVSNEGERSVP